MRILIATDGSEYSYRAAREFLRFSHAAHHEITALYVVPLLTVGRAVEYLEIEKEREAADALNTVRHIFTESGVSIKTAMRQGNPTDTILQVIREEEFDLVVIGPRGRGGFREALLGSVSKHIIRDASCSVFIGK